MYKADIEVQAFDFLLTTTRSTIDSTTIWAKLLSAKFISMMDAASVWAKASYASLGSNAAQAWSTAAPWVAASAQRAYSASAVAIARSYDASSLIIRDTVQVPPSP